MADYDKLSEFSYNPKVRTWRFRVKLLRIYSFSSDVTNSGSFYTYVLVDEDGSKMEMKVYGEYDRFRGLENQEGKWVEIFLVEVERSYPVFQATNSRFNLIATRYTKIRIIDPPLNDRLFMDFKNIHAILHMSNREQNYPIDTMGVVFNTEAHFDDPGRPRTVFYIRDNIDIQIKCVATGKHAYAFRDGLKNMNGGQVIVALKMRVWKVWNYFGPPDMWLETGGGMSDFRFNPRLSELENSRQSLLNSDPYVQKYGVEGLV